MRRLLGLAWLVIVLLLLLVPALGLLAAALLCLAALLVSNRQRTPAASRSPAPSAAAPVPAAGAVELPAPPPMPATGEAWPEEERRLRDDTLTAFADACRVCVPLLASARKLDDELNRLDPRQWASLMNLPVDGQIVDRLVVGPGGVFVIEITAGSWNMSDVAAVGAKAKAVARRLPGYPDPVRAGIYQPAGGAEVRQWFGNDGSSAWLVGADGFYGWLQSFEDLGLSSSDVRVLRDLVQRPMERVKSRWIPPTRIAQG